MAEHDDKATAAAGQLGVGAADQPGVVAADERLATLIFAAFLAFFGLFWVWASLDLPSRQQTAYLTQGFLPITAGFLLAGLSALLFLSTWFKKARPANELGREPIFEKDAELRALGIFSILLAYIIALPHIHYLITTFFLMAAGLAIAREPIRPRLFILAAVMSLIFFLIFIWGIQLPLPGSRFT